MRTHLVEFADRVVGFSPLLEDTAAEFKKTYHEDNTLCLPNTRVGGKGNTLQWVVNLWLGAAEELQWKVSHANVRTLMDNISRETALLLARCLCV